MRKRVALCLGSLALLAALSLHAQPSLMLDGTGICFPDGTVQRTSATEPPATATVHVDCGSSDSINEALQTPAVDLTIEISGVCIEDVLIQRDRVTLSGLDPSSAIHGAAIVNEPGLAVVKIQHAYGVRLEYLEVAQGVRHGIYAFESGGLEVFDCELSGNGHHGIIAADTDGEITDSTLSGNSGGGARLLNGSDMRFLNSTLAGNGDNRFALLSGEASYAYVFDSTISGDHGIVAYMSGFIYAEDTPITAGVYAAVASEQGDINLVGDDSRPDITGSLAAELDGFLWALNIHQPAASGLNTVSEDSTIFLWDTTLNDPLHLSTFGNGDVRQGSFLDAVTCETGADLHCDGTTTLTSSTCGLCPVPPPPPTGPLGSAGAAGAGTAADRADLRSILPARGEVP